MRFNDLKKDELQQAVNFYKVEVDADATKAELTTALLDAGHTPEEWERDSEEYGYGEKEVQSKPASTALTSAALRDAQREQDYSNKEETAGAEEPKKAEEPVDDNLVLVRFVGTNRNYFVGRHRFSGIRPFALLSREEFEALDQSKFREASKEEANEFYG